MRNFDIFGHASVWPQIDTGMPFLNYPREIGKVIKRDLSTTHRFLDRNQAEKRTEPKKYSKAVGHC